MTSLWVVLAISLVHAVAGSTSALRLHWRARVLSAAAGISVAYVFLELIPNLAHAQELLESRGVLPKLESPIFVVTLIGVITAFWLETETRKSRRVRRSAGVDDEAGTGLFHLTVVVHVIQNAAIGYGVARLGDDTKIGLGLYAMAMGLHAIVNDHALAEHYGARYRARGRWLLITGLIGGWVAGMVPVLEIPSDALALVLAYVAGMVIMNVFRHELPDTDRTADAAAFAAGAAVLGALLLLSSAV